MAARDVHKNYEFRPLEKVELTYDDIKDTKHEIKELKENITIKKKLQMLSGQVKENITMDNIIAVTIPEDHYLGYYCHWTASNVINSSPFIFSYGRIGALSIMTKYDLVTPTTEEFVRLRSRELAIHIVGMLPTKLELSDENEIKESIDKDSYVGDIEKKIDLDNYVGGSLLEQPFFFRKSQKVRLWAMKNNLLVVDFVLME